MFEALCPNLVVSQSDDPDCSGSAGAGGRVNSYTSNAAMGFKLALQPAEPFELDLQIIKTNCLVRLRAARTHFICSLIEFFLMQSSFERDYHHIRRENTRAMLHLDTMTHSPRFLSLQEELFGTRFDVFLEIRRE